MQSQLDLDLRSRTWGGKREGAGRKPVPDRRDPMHRRRPDHKERFPIHVVLRTRAEIGRLRRGPMLRAARRALHKISGRVAFRVVHISIQHNHLHLLAEAESKHALSRGMQAFAISAAKAINASLERSGKVFAYRYHSTVLASPRQTRNALAYVLNNWRRHREDERGGERARTALVDPYSSALSFNGWRGVTSFAIPAGYEPLPVARPQTWLLRIGWAIHGPIDPHAVPGPLR